MSPETPSGLTGAAAVSPASAPPPAPHPATVSIVVASSATLSVLFPMCPAPFQGSRLGLRCGDGDYVSRSLTGKARASLAISNRYLWWCRGLGRTVFRRGGYRCSRQVVRTRPVHFPGVRLRRVAHDTGSVPPKEP